MNQSIENSYKICLDLANTHYENFPVASLLIPKDKRKFIASVYAFARIADDIADEGFLPPETKVEKLIEYKNLFIAKKLDLSYPHLPAVYHTLETNNLTEINFTKLIDAFIQDNQKNIYETWDDLFDYCSKSANPVGRILLEIFNIRSESALKFSDDICTALQLTNFYQDLKIDIPKNRFYIPQEHLEIYNLTNYDLINFINTKSINDNFRNMLENAILITENLFNNGRGLLNLLSGLFKKEINLTIEGGLTILSKIRKHNYDVIKHRPKLNKLDWLKIIGKVLLNG